MQEEIKLKGGGVRLSKEWPLHARSLWYSCPFGASAAPPPNSVRSSLANETWGKIHSNRLLQHFDSRDFDFLCTAITVWSIT